MNSEYNRALSFYTQGDYEKAFDIISTLDLVGNEKGRVLFVECKRQIVQQYGYLIKSFIEQGQYEDAEKAKRDFISKYGSEQLIDSINIPQNMPNISKKGMNVGDTFKNFNLKYLSIIVIALLALAFFLIKMFEDKITIETLLEDTNKEIIYADDDYALYIHKVQNASGNGLTNQYYYNKLYRATLGTDNTNEYTIQKNSKSQESESCYIKNFILNDKRDAILLNVIWMSNDKKYESLYKFDPITGKLGTIISSSPSIVFTEKDIRVVLEENILETGNTFQYYNLYDFNGEKVNSKHVFGNGYIDKYPIYMSMHCVEGKITGWYLYEGHTNYMTIKGERIDSPKAMDLSGDFVFTEYDEYGNEHATFGGTAYWEENRLRGNFYKDFNKLSFNIN